MCNYEFLFIDILFSFLKFVLSGVTIQLLVLFTAIRVSAGLFLLREVPASMCTDSVTQSDQLACLTGHSDRVVSVACSSKGVICTTALDCTIKLWQPHLVAVDESIGHDAEVTSVACSPDGAWAVSGSRCVFVVFGFVCLLIKLFQ